MKTKEKKVKDFDTVAILGDIKEKISKEIHGMNFEQLTAYLHKNKLRS